MATTIVVSLLLLFSSVLGAPTSTCTIYDLGFDLSNNTQWWPGVQKFEITEKSRQRDIGGNPWLAVNTVELAEHVGTHVDAPFHFVENGWKLGDIPLERFYADGELIDVEKEANDDFKFEVLPRHIEAWEKKHGEIPEKSIVLFRLGWSKNHYSNHDDYFGIGKTNDSDLNFPGLSKAAAQLLVKRNVYGVGLDTPSLDPGHNVPFEAHQTLLNAKIFGIESLNLANTDIPAKGFKIHVMPMKITEGTGAPARVMAFVDEKKSKHGFLHSLLHSWT